MPRITRIAGSFAIVVIAYWAYALAAVPWLEPPADLGRADAITNQERESGQLVDAQIKSLRGLFPANRWELQNPKILESGRAKLLFQRYDNSFPDGHVELHPCTVVFAYDGPARDEAERIRQSVILEVPEGVRLWFDQPVDISKGKIGRLKSGQFDGPVTIRSDGKEPGPEDDLLIVTHDVQLTEQTIVTPNPVDFRWGPHFGRGQDMLIKLSNGPPASGEEGSGPNITGLESFELRHVERLHLELGQPTPTPGAKPSSVPVEIHCQGPFVFDAIRRVATFHDRVDVMKANPSGPSDQLAGELLSLYFVPRPKEKPPQGPAKADPTPAGSLDLMAERIVAEGNPAVVTAPSQNVVSRAGKLEYNLLTSGLTLSGGQEAFLQQGSNEIHARSVSYQSAEPGHLGRVTAQGPGWLRGQSPHRPDQKLEALWKDQLRVYPAEGKQVISLTGGAELKFQGVGQLQARETYFWLTEVPPAAKNQQSQLHPHCMVARNDVHMNSPLLASKVEQLEVWFKDGAQGAGGRGLGMGDKGQGAGDGGRGRGGSPSVALVSQTSATEAVQRFEVVGRLLRAQVLLGEPQPLVPNLTIEDGVCFRETQTARPGERPLMIRGDRLEAADLTAPSTAVTVIGRPARFEGRGLGLTGTNINLNRGENHLWIEGPGQMDLPLPANARGDMLTTGGVLTVDWQRRMDFDGHTAVFEASVVAATPQQQLHTETMRVRLQRPINFSQSNLQDPAQVEEIQCSGGVLMESRTFDQQQQLTAHDQMQLSDLGVNLLSGALTGGSGWLNSVRYGADDTLGGPATAAAGNPPAKPTPSQNQLHCLHVRFQRSLVGNILQRQLTFSDQVRMAYGPVDNWDAMLTTNDPNLLGPDGLAVRCDQLSVNQMLLPIGGRRAFEVEAQGNAVIEGTTFTARGNRATYAQAKDLLILEGDGRNHADLFRQLQPGAEPAQLKAQKILYWLKSKKASVIGAESLEIGPMPQGKGK